MRVLVIRLGALGDLFLSFPAFAAIRAHHGGDEITLLTAAPFAGLARASPWFDAVQVDGLPARLDLFGRRRLARELRGFDLVYDLQTSGRSSSYHALAGRPAWSGIAPGCSLPHDDPGRDWLHTVDRQDGQLRRAGITVRPPVALDWLRADPGAPGGPGAADELKRAGSYAVLVPGAAPHRPAKRGPAARFAELARALAAIAVTPVLVGGADDRRLGTAIAAEAAGTVDLTGRTTLRELARLLAGAAVAVGNDTGPMHVAATMGCPAVVLFSAASDPALTAPRGPAPVRVLRCRALAALETATVFDAARALLGSARDRAPPIEDSA